MRHNRLHQHQDSSPRRVLALSCDSVRLDRKDPCFPSLVPVDATGPTVRDRAQTPSSKIFGVTLVDTRQRRGYSRVNASSTPVFAHTQTLMLVTVTNWCMLSTVKTARPRSAGVRSKNTKTERLWVQLRQTHHRRQFIPSTDWLSTVIIQSLLRSASRYWIYMAEACVERWTLLLTCIRILLQLP